MTPAEELRTAAKLIRERAEAVSSPDWPGKPWQVTECSEHGCPCIVYQGDYKPFDEPQVPGIQYVADAESPADAEHIASWHPLVALAVADWLDAEYRHSKADYPSDIECVDNLPLMVARAYLGSETEAAT
jgi:hypothetical protein